MSDVVLDTNLLSDLIACYYELEIRTGGEFQEYKRITEKFSSKLNQILNDFRNYSSLENGVIVASSFAFIELARKFDEISEGSFSLDQFRAFIDSPPEWFVIAPISNDLFPFLSDIPSNVKMPNGDISPIEWADSIHVATAKSRDLCGIATTDGKLLEIDFVKRNSML